MRIVTRSLQFLKRIFQKVERFFQPISDLCQCVCNCTCVYKFESNVFQAVKNDDNLQLQSILIENRDLVHFQSDLTDEGVYLVHKAAQLDRPICFDVLV